MGRGAPDLRLSEQVEWIRWTAEKGGAPRSALRHLEHCLQEVEAARFQLLLTKARLLGSLQRWSEQAEVVEALEKGWPQEPDVLFERVELECARGDFKTALALLRPLEAVFRKRGGGDWECYLSARLECLVSLGRRREARRLAAQALASDARLDSPRVYLEALGGRAPARSPSKRTPAPPEP